MKEKISNFITSQKGSFFVWLFLTIYAGYSVCYLLNVAGFAEQINQQGFSQSALSVIVFVGMGCFLRDVWKEYRGRLLLFALLFGCALGLSFIWGYQIRLTGITHPGYKNKLVELLMSMGLGVAFLPLTGKWFLFLDRIGEKRKQQELSGKAKLRMFWFSLLGIILCWLPVFLAYYPAIMSYDFHRQSQEATLGYIWFNDHHPLLHTFLIRMAFLLGESIGSYEAGMAIFSALQMLLLAAVLAYSCNVIGRVSGKVWPVVVTAVLYGVLPIHPVLAMSMTKDILFTTFFLLLILLIWERRRLVVRLQGQAEVTTAEKWKRSGLFFAILITGILTLILRNNAIYAFAVFAVFYVLIASGERLRIALLCLAIVVGGIGCKTGIREAMGAGKGSSAEMFSVIMQQFARTGQNQCDNLTPEDWSMINRYVDHEFWGDYNPVIADSVKICVGVYCYDTWKEDFGRMLKDWVSIGLRYPNEYIDAFLALTSGYWFLDDVSHAEVLGYGEDTNLGLLYTFNASVSDAFEGVESRSFLPGLLTAYQKIVNGNSYYSWPVLSLLFKPAFYCWLLVLAIVSFWYKKEPKKQLFTLLPLLYLLTLFLGPVVNFRYVYPITVVVPVLLAEVLQVRENQLEGK